MAQSTFSCKDQIINIIYAEMLWNVVCWTLLRLFDKQLLDMLCGSVDRRWIWKDFGIATWQCSAVTPRMFLLCVHHTRKLVHTLDLRRSMCTIPWNSLCPCPFGNPVVTVVRWAFSKLLEHFVSSAQCHGFLGCDSDLPIDEADYSVAGWLLTVGLYFAPFCPHAYEKSFPLEFRKKFPSFSLFLEDEDIWRRLFVFLLFPIFPLFAGSKLENLTLCKNLRCRAPGRWAMQNVVT